MKREHGSIMTVVVIVLFLAVAGFGVWRFYESTKQSYATQANAQEDPNDGYVVVENWGVRFKPAADLSGVVYQVGNRVAGVEATAMFSTSALAQYGDSCSANLNSKAPLGLLTRTKEVKEEFVSESGAFVKHIGEYYYQYSTPQTACADNAEANQLQTQTVNRFKISIASLELKK